MSAPWISVKDALPEMDQGVLVYGQDPLNRDRPFYETVCRMSDGTPDGWGWIMREGRMRPELVTHWMPLPEKPG